MTNSIIISKLSKRQQFAQIKKVVLEMFRDGWDKLTGFINGFVEGVFEEGKKLFKDVFAEIIVNGLKQAFNAVWNFAKNPSVGLGFLSRQINDFARNTAQQLTNASASQSASSIVFAFFLEIAWHAANEISRFVTGAALPIPQPTDWVTS